MSGPPPCLTCFPKDVGFCLAFGRERKGDLLALIFLGKALLFIGILWDSYNDTMEIEMDYKVHRFFNENSSFDLGIN